MNFISFRMLAASMVSLTFNFCMQNVLPNIFEEQTETFCSRWVWSRHRRSSIGMRRSLARSNAPTQRSCAASPCQLVHSRVRRWALQAAGTFRSPDVNRVRVFSLIFIQKYYSKSRFNLFCFLLVARGDAKKIPFSATKSSIVICALRAHLLLGSQDYLKNKRDIYIC